MANDKQSTRQLAKTYADHGDPNGWFEAFYARADGDIRRIYWADLKPHPLLVDWVACSPLPDGKRAIIVGCGLGDDAEVLSQRGYAVTAFDISPSAIAMCRERYPDSAVHYCVADLFDLPAGWIRGFDLVYECNTIQILHGPDRVRALTAITELVAPGGEIVVSCRCRDAGQGLDAFPLPLDRNEIDGFLRAGLTERHFNVYDDDQTPPVPHYFAVYRRDPLTA